jgi:hypothetical protein
MDALPQLSPDTSAEYPTSIALPEEAIRERAYEIYERRGRQDGFAEEDWLQAELELRAELRVRQETWSAT